MREVRWRTRMARLAALERRGRLGGTQCDRRSQFWWPRGGDLREVLGAVPTRFGAIHAFGGVFVPRAARRCSLRRAMILVICTPGIGRRRRARDRPLARVLHRGTPGVSVSSSETTPLPASRELCCSIGTRSRSCTFRGGRPSRWLASHATSWRRGRATRPRITRRPYRAMTKSERSRSETLMVDDTTLAGGYEARVVEKDTRIRDRLRALAGLPELERGGGHGHFRGRGQRGVGT